MKNILLIGLIVVVGAAAVFFFVSQRQSSPTGVTDSQEDTTELIEPTPYISASPDTSALRAGGSSFTDAQNIFTVLYPADYAQDTQGEDRYIRLTKRGATQKGQTELYDGVMVVFETINLNGQPLAEWVDAHIAQATADETSEVVAGRQPVSLNNYPGFTYSMRGLGTFEYLVVQKDPQSQYAVSLTTLVADPENVGYQEEVDAILSTLELRK